ncbi:hypothetical protein V496_07391 [Pseudogymnoascus sp. VKM F-4515 (FW-2607)]|nr:hypothetical protein V496_07391 [Pseudogymnoascus sp. VKM F-4515 (FW-2607)]
MSEAPSAPAQSYSTDPHLYIYTSLTAGSSHIVTATSRLETILRANRIPFKAIDLATDEKARMIWGRRAGKDESGRQRKIPGLVQEGMVVGDLVEIEDWNEYGELKQHVRIVGVSSTPPRPAGFGNPIKAAAAAAATPAAPVAPVAPAAPAAPAAPTAPPLPTGVKLPIPRAPEPMPAPKEKEALKTPTTGANSINLTMRQMGEEAAQRAKDMKKKTLKAKPEVFVGSGTGEAIAKDTKESAATETVQTVEPITILQDPKTSAWNVSPASTPPVSQHALNEMKSLQSPTSTAWKVVDVSLPIAKSGESEASTTSAENAKHVEKKEVTEDDDEDDEDEDEDDDDDEDDEEDDDDDEEEDDDDDDEDEDEDEEDEGNEKKEPKKA